MNKIKTIIVDDESRIRRGIERLIRSCGDEWEIVAAFSDGLEAFETITKDSLVFDLLISDIKMPEMDGLTLNNELKKYSTFLTIFISGYDDFEYLQSALKSGAANYILKPIDKEQFQVQLNEIKERIIAEYKKRHEWEKIKEKAAKLDYTKQVQLLSEMIWNEERDISYLDWTREFPAGSYQLVHFSIDHVFSKTKDFSSKEWNTWIFAVENILEEVMGARFNQKGKRWWWRSNKFDYWVLFNDKSLSGLNGSLLKETNQFAQELRYSIQKYTPFTVSAAISKIFMDLSILGNTKKQLQTLMQFRMIHGSNQTFQASIIKSSSNEKNQGITSTILKSTEQIVNALVYGKREELINSLQGYFRELESITSPVNMNEAVHYLMIRIVNSWIENNGYREEPELLAEALNMTRHAGNFVQLKDSIKQWVLKVMSKITVLKAEQQNPVLESKKWIKNNLHENITIKKIAQQVYMNPNYFCDYFKAQTGETVLDYVTTVRLEKAKELLTNSDLKIAEIAISVGYHDTKYFRRLFKQWLGQTPSQYRDQHSVPTFEK
ncbi:response regulator transcription factor [Neobacillus muris]|uniref:response regulator transcription factor n=1 Tax=Neobacillus muris TaxID=2941334 RepID=UPI002040C066|nr:helix-turn-helix domain-containing protein [Neobacillus muris]